MGVVEVNAFGPIDIVTAAYLPKTSDPGTHPSPLRCEARFQRVVLEAAKRAGAHEGHVAANHVPQLRKLVQAGLAEKSA